MNLVILTGRLGANPEVRYIPNGTAVGNFRMATTDMWRDKEGERHERTEWHNVVVWGRLAETCGKYLAKGRQVTITGSLHTRSWDDKDGNKRYRTEVTGQRVEFLDSGNKNGAAKQEVQSTDGTPVKTAPVPQPISSEESSVGYVPEAGLPPDEAYDQEATQLLQNNES